MDTEKVGATGPPRMGKCQEIEKPGDEERKGIDN